MEGRQLISKNGPICSSFVKVIRLELYIPYDVDLFAQVINLSKTYAYSNWWDFKYI